MQYLLYYDVCFRVWGTTKEVFVVDVMEATLANHKVFTRWHAQAVEVTSTQYKKANGIPSPPSSDIDSP
jgi:hypothetical protein